MQAHGPGFSKILLGDDVVDNWEKYLDIMADSVFINSGRGCINCSGIWASRHTEEIAEAIAEKHRPDRSRCRRKTRRPAWPRSPCPARPTASGSTIEADLKEAGVTDMTAKYGPRLVEAGALRLPAADDRALRLAGQRRSPRRNTCSRSPPSSKCPQDKMLEKIGPTLVCSAITEDKKFQRAADRRHAHRPAEHRPDPDDQAQLAAAARGQHRRFPVPHRAYQVA